MAQAAIFDIFAPVVRIDDIALTILGNRVDG